MPAAREMGRRRNLLWLGLGALCAAAALLRAATASAPPVGAPLSAAVREEAYRFVAEDERAARDRAKENFASDRWSQDDDFHASERTRVNDFADTRKLSRAEVFRAVDDGMRERWPLPEAVQVRATVAPCKPRPVY